MKITRHTLSALLALTAAVGVHAADANSPARVEVTFENPDKFADAADGQRGSDFGRDANLAELRDYLVRRASLYVPENQRLSVTVTDVDFAGEVEPWRTARMGDARLVKDIYPPRIELNFRLIDASGAVVREGTRRLTDLAFLMTLHGVDRSDPRIHEKELLDRWVRSEFAKSRKK